MKTIEERAVLNLEYERDLLGNTLSEDMVRRAYIKGCYDQKSIDDEMRVKKYDDITKEEYNRMMAFVDWYLTNGERAPTYSDAIEWARKQTIDEIRELSI